MIGLLENRIVAPLKEAMTELCNEAYNREDRITEATLLA